MIELTTRKVTIISRSELKRETEKKVAYVLKDDGYITVTEEEG